MIHGVRLLGILMLFTRAGHTPGPEEQPFLETVAGTIALLIDRWQGASLLRQSEANLARAQQVAQLGYWEWDVHNDRITHSQEVLKIFGTAERETAANLDNFLNLIHPDDVAEVRAAILQALYSHNHYSQTCRIIRPDGSIRIIHTEGDIELTKEGEPLRIFGTVQDITQLKKNEQQLKLAAKVFDSSIEGITITDTKGIIQSVNRSFSHITGYSAAEALGKKTSILKSDRHDQAFYRAMWQALEANGKWEGEIWNRRKNGEIFPEHLSITTVPDCFGRPESFVAVFHDLSEMRGIEEKLQFQAYHDALTGLPNRTLLLDRLRVACRHAELQKQMVAILTIDLDNFKHVNDSLGHTVGDVLLQQVAQRLRENMATDFTVARLGGDDFAILMEYLSSEEEAVWVAQSVISSFAAPFNLTVYEPVVTVSIGISYFPADGADADNLLKNAELAMYRAKEIGKNCYQLFTKGMNTQVVHRLSLENSLRKALAREEFIVYHQPKVSLVSGGIIGMEALVRWQAADGRLIPPLDFIPLAEETGLIIPIGAHVLRQACLDAGGWLREYNPDLLLSVNLSPRQFRQKDLLASVRTILKKTGLPPEHLELEITESAVMANEQEAIALLLKLKSLGIRLGLDDFGTGYSSLHYLRKLPFDTIKMDRAFVKDLPDDNNCAAIARTILSLAHDLGMEVVAEGVETTEQLAFLQHHHCAEIQGYLFSPPVPAESFASLLREGRRLPLADPDAV